jgi:predicted transcriptional regulator
MTEKIIAVPVSVALPEYTIAWLKKQAAAQDRSVSYIVRLAIDQYKREEEKKKEQK